MNDPLFSLFNRNIFHSDIRKVIIKQKIFFIKLIDGKFNSVVLKWIQSENIYEEFYEKN